MPPRQPRADALRTEGLDSLRVSLLEPPMTAAEVDSGVAAEEDGGGAPGAVASEEPGDRRSLALSFATLLFSIPALIGA